MPRTRKPIRPVSIHLKLPEDLVARIELELFSETEGRVPQGAKQGFFERLAREYFANKIKPVGELVEQIVAAGVPS